MIEQSTRKVERKGDRPRRVGLVAALSKEEAQELAASVATALRNAGAEVILEERLAADGHESADAYAHSSSALLGAA